MKRGARNKVRGQKKKPKRRVPFFLLVPQSNEVSPAMIAYRVTDTASCRLSFCIMLERCLSSVLGLTPKIEAASLVDFP